MKRISIIVILLLSFSMFVNCSSVYSAIHSSTKSVSDDVKTLADLKSKGLGVIEGQSFSIQFENWGNVRFVSMNRGLSVSFYLVGDDETILYSLPKFSRFWANSCESLRAIAFADVNRDGLADIIIIADCVSADGKRFPVAGIYFQKGKEFIADYVLNEQLNDTHNNETIDMILEFMRGIELDTFAGLQAKGLKLIEDQSFPVELENWGKVRFVSMSKRPYHIFFYLIDNDGKILYSFPEHFGYGWNFWKVRAVSFVDANRDGLTDVIVIAEYTTGHGPNGARPFPIADIYFQKGKEFINSHEIADKLNFGIQKNQNVDMVLEFMSKDTH